MNGAESLVRTLLNSDVNVCFANPGTSEMHFVSALDRVEGVRCILGLFEGVVTGAADGYYRMAGKPAATLLHLGPGLGNGLANLHNAKKARSGIVNIVGEHASYHIQHDAPLTADIEGVARPMSDWVKTSRSSSAVAADGALAVEAARKAPGQIATLILPADTAWGEAEGPVNVKAPAPRERVPESAIADGVRALTSGQTAAILLGGAALRGKPMVFYHRSWPYFVKRFGVRVVGYVEDRPGIPPTAAHRDSLLGLIRANSVKVIEVTHYYDDRIPKQLAEATGARMAKVAGDVGGTPEATDNFALIDSVVKALIP